MPSNARSGTQSNRFIIVVIGVLAAVYVACLATGRIASDTHHTAESEPHVAAPGSSAMENDARAPDSHPADSQSPEQGDSPQAPHEAAHADEHGAEEPPLYAILPFMMLLGAIALMPLLAATEDWWESNLHRFYVSAGTALLTLTYYAMASDPIASVSHVLEHALVDEYLPFIVLLFSLYTISGGIRIEGDLRASPRTNCCFIGVGGLLASFIGTTGAAMILIRPLLDTNDERKYVQHTVVFFIFVVCNCGGCLLPIGDPPLFLGYLEGVDFMWTMWNLWQPWLFVNGVLIGLYFLIDRGWFYPHERIEDLLKDAKQTSPLSIRGLWPNAFLLVGVVLCVALLDPKKPILGWHPLPYLREVGQLTMVALSLMVGSEKVRDDNRFDYHAIVEVAALFIGIFICMQPALEMLNIRGPSLGMDTAWKLFAATGVLSSVLDNAPTYLVFFRTAAAQYGGPGEFAALVSETGETALTAKQLLAGISLGAVFMGSMTYIGNGPNFMVRAIAEQSGVRMPSFFGFAFRYSIPILVPILTITVLLFL